MQNLKSLMFPVLAAAAIWAGASGVAVEAATKGATMAMEVSANGATGKRFATMRREATADKTKPEVRIFDDGSIAMEVDDDTTVQRLPGFDEDELMRIKALESEAPVFSKPEEKTFTGSSGQCEYRADGVASNLPLGKSPYTIEMKIKPEGVDATRCEALVNWGGFNGGAYDTNRGVGFGIEGDHQTLDNWWWRAGGCKILTAKSLNDGNYHHVAATWGGPGQPLKVFLDYQKVCEKTQNWDLNIQTKDTFCVGGLKTATFNLDCNYKGKLKDLKIWNVAQDIAARCRTDAKLDSNDAHWAGRCKTLEECKQACAAWNGCTGFNWWPEKGGCRLVKGVLTTTPTAHVTVSGAKDCTFDTSSNVATAPTDTATCSR